MHMLGEAFLSGFWAAIGSSLGKLSGTSTVVGESYLLWAGLLILMILVNTYGCRYYLRSLDAATNTVTPTVVSSTSNYLLSGIIGMVGFGESVSILWWAGATLIAVGLALVATPAKTRKE